MQNQTIEANLKAEIQQQLNDPIKQVQAVMRMQALVRGAFERGCAARLWRLIRSVAQPCGCK